MQGQNALSVSPTQRKSARDKSPVNYKQIVEGGMQPISEENDPNKTDAKKLAKNNKKIDLQKKVEVARQRMTDFFKNLSSHEHAHLFDKPIDKTNPLYEQYKTKWKILTIIKMRFNNSQQY